MGSASRTITVNSTVSWNGPIAGDAGIGFTKLGPGTLTLAPAVPGTFTGTLDHTAGTLTVSPNGLGSAAKVVLNSTGNSPAPVFNTFGTGTANDAAFSTPFEIGGDMILGINSTGRPMVHDGNTTLRGTGAIHTLTINRDLVERGIISDGGNGNGLRKGGTNQLRLTGANTFSGGFIFEGVSSSANNNVFVGHSDALGSGTITINAGSTNRLASDSANPIALPNAVDFGADLILGSFNAAAAVTAAATFTGYSNVIVPANTPTGKLTFSGARGPIRLVGGSRTLTLFAEAEISGNVGEDLPGLGLTKAGAAQLTLSGANTYSGDTIVSGGTLLVNSPGALAGGNVQVNSGTLGGNGRIGGSVVLGAGAGLAPGAPAGTLSILGGLDISAAGTGTLAFELNTPATSDKIAVTGQLTVGTGLLGFNDFTFTNLGGMQAGTYPLVSGGGLAPGNTLDPANLTGTIEAFTATLRLTGSTLELVVTGGGAAGYTAWKTANAGGQGPELDWDKDGVGNGVEYFMNAAAGFTANPALNAAKSITWPNGGNIAASAYGTQFVVQTSGNLQIWTDVPAASLTTNTNGPGGSLTYTLTGTGPRFVRLKVTPN